MEYTFSKNARAKSAYNDTQQEEDVLSKDLLEELPTKKRGNIQTTSAALRSITWWILIRPL